MLSQLLLISMACSSGEDSQSSGEQPPSLVGEPSGELSVDTGSEDVDPVDEPKAQFVPHAEDGVSVEQVDPPRYLGLWYEIATTPSQQQSFCSGTMAEYSLVDEDTVGVTNRCYVGDLDGRLNEAQATARALDDTFARLMVDFGYGFEAPYTVVELFQPAEEDEPYSYAVVTSGEYQYWILSRTPQMPAEMYETLLQLIDDRGSDSSRLIETEQPSETEQ